MVLLETIMIILSNTTDSLKLETSAAVSSIEVQCSFVDLPQTTQIQEPGVSVSTITTATTTTFLPAPLANVDRGLKDLSVYNSSSDSCEVTLIKGDAGGDVKLYSATLSGKTSLHYAASEGFYKSAGVSGNVVNDTVWNTKGDLIVGTGENSATRLPIGVDDYILVADSQSATGVAWEIKPSVSADGVFDAKGDLVVGTGDNTATRLPVGTNGYQLIADQQCNCGSALGGCCGSRNKARRLLDPD